MADTTMGIGIEEAPQPFRLRVSGNSGCNCYNVEQADPCRRVEYGLSDR